MKHSERPTRFDSNAQAESGEFRVCEVIGFEDYFALAVQAAENDAYIRAPRDALKEIFR